MSDNEAFSKCTNDAPARFDSPKPQAATVPCVWDNKQQIYVPVYSHRGVEIKDRIEALEAALREVIDCWDWWQVDTYDRCASVPADAIRDARKALEGKDD